MANESTMRPQTMKVPVNYPKTPVPGKLHLIYDSNKRELYHKLSPYGSDTFLGIKSRQPFIYRYPDENIGTMQKEVKREFPFAAAVTDVERITKFMVSGQGVLWLGKQFLLQTGNAFNETRIWNPTSPIVAAGMPLAFWAVRPTRHLDTSDLLGSILGGVGKAIGGLFGAGGSPPPPPKGTVATALPDRNTFTQGHGKGLIRAQTANTGVQNFSNIWVGTKKGNFFGDFIKGMFANFIPTSQKGISGQTPSARADEGAYGKMINAGNHGMFQYEGKHRNFETLTQRWVAGNIHIRLPQENNDANAGMLYTFPDSIPTVYNQRFVSFTVTPPDGQSIQVGYDIRPSPIERSPGIRYEDAMGVKVDGEYRASDVMVQWELYQRKDREYKSKQTDISVVSVTKTRETLQKVIDSLKQNLIYEIEENPESQILPPAYQENIGYNKLLAMSNRQGSNPVMSGKYGVLKEYKDRNIRMLEAKHTDDPKNKSMKMATSGYFDGINSLNVLDGEDVRNEKWEEWRPYRDDIIAFYFYDVVNDKYIPFRATIRGLQETDTADWQELSFLGRADRLYSYGGFNRALSFSFTVNISSIWELAPTWQRINYLMSLVKPSSYTHRSGEQIMRTLHTRYIVPPMVMVTIGDLYKNQPVVIGSAGITIPDTALWETLNEENSPDGWSYLANYIKSPDVKKEFGQLPKTAEISINAFLLEKERAVVGAAHFGHAPHTELYQKDLYRNTAPDYQAPKDIHKYLVVYNEQRPLPKSTAMSP